ncbi:hypothetical protein D3C81_1468750 [compost metagenome]
MLQIGCSLDADWIKNETSATRQRLVGMNTVELFTQYRIKATIGQLLKYQGVVALISTAWQHH